MLRTKGAWPEGGLGGEAQLHMMALCAAQGISTPTPRSPFPWRGVLRRHGDWPGVPWIRIKQTERRGDDAEQQLLISSAQAITSSSSALNLNNNSKSFTAAASFAE